MIASDDLVVVIDPESSTGVHKPIECGLRKEEEEEVAQKCPTLAHTSVFKKKSLEATYATHTHDSPSITRHLLLLTSDNSQCPSIPLLNQLTPSPGRERSMYRLSYVRSTRCTAMHTRTTRGGMSTVRMTMGTGGLKRRLAPVSQSCYCHLTRERGGNRRDPF